jgi:hypothetical protein
MLPALFLPQEKLIEKLKLIMVASKLTLIIIS